MGLRVPFQGRYLICQSSTITEVKDFSAGSMGVELSKYALPLTNRPHVSRGQNIVHTPKSLGLSERKIKTGYEYFSGTYLPVVTLEFDYTEHLASLFLWLLFQKGASEGAGPGYQKDYIPYVDPEPEIYCNIARIMSDSDSDGFLIKGGVCRSLTVSGREGEVVKVSAEMIGASKWAFNFGSGVFNWSERAPEMFQDITSVLISTAEAKNDFREFSVTVTNNVVPKYCNSQVPIRFVLGKLEATGTFVLNWDHATRGGLIPFADWRDNDVRDWQVVFDSGASSFHIRGSYRNVEVVNEEQATIRHEIESAHFSTSDYGIAFEVTDSQERGIT